LRERKELIRGKYCPLILVELFPPVVFVLLCFCLLVFIQFLYITKELNFVDNIDYHITAAAPGDNENRIQYNKS